MLPAAKVLLVTVLLGGGTVGTYALAGGKFGTGGSGAGNAETTTQVSAPESTTPASDGQARAVSAAPVAAEPPAAPRGEDTLEGNTQDRDPSNTLSSVDPEKAPGSADSSLSPESRPEIRAGEETIPAEEQQRDSLEEGSPSGDGHQELPVAETLGVSEGNTAGTKSNLEEASNEAETNSSGRATSETQTGQGNVPSQNDQVSKDLSQGGQPATGSTQDKGGENGVNQSTMAVTTDLNTNTEEHNQGRNSSSINH